MSDDSTDLGKARQIDRDIVAAHSVVNHSSQWKQKDRFRSLDQSRSALWSAHLIMQGAIHKAEAGDGNAVDEAYADDVPATLAFVRDHPGVSGKEAVTVITRVHHARALLGAYPEGYELAKREGRVPSE